MLLWANVQLNGGSTNHDVSCRQATRPGTGLQGRPPGHWSRAWLHDTRVRPSFAHLRCRGASCEGGAEEPARVHSRNSLETHSRTLIRVSAGQAFRRGWWRGQAAAAATGVASCHLLIHRPPPASTSPLGAGRGRGSSLRLLTRGFQLPMWPRARRFANHARRPNPPPGKVKGKWSSLAKPKCTRGGGHLYM